MLQACDFDSVPIVDISPLVTGQGDSAAVASRLGQACRDCGFFYIVGHGVDERLIATLEAESRTFFALPTDLKMQIAMARGGRAWRGYFPVGGELTSGKPDQKEGLYLGTELPAHHPLVVARTPMHGANLFPEGMPVLRQAILDYMAAMTLLGHTLMAALAVGLGLEKEYFESRYTGDPLTLFRIFNYPPVSPADAQVTPWGVGEHTDYGMLTILRQDDSGGLEVKSRSSWVAAPPVPGSFVCNLGDMLDRMTGGVYRSTPHRVRTQTRAHRLSLPFFFDPNFFVEVKPIELGRIVNDDKSERWDRMSVHEFRGTYGDYLVNKVSKVFPQLVAEVTP